MSTISSDQAVGLLKQNQVVAVPTETVYGLAGRIYSEEALKSIFSTKERPFFDPLIVHVLDATQAQQLVSQWPKVYEVLAARFWPGPLTLVTPKSSLVHSLITSGLPTVGLRSPAHPVARAILEKLGEPFAAPSANRFGRTSPTRAEHVDKEFNGKVAVVDGGPSQVGIESTVVRLKENPQLELEILRPGAISKDQLEEALGEQFPYIKIHRVVSDASPGHLEVHYQPQHPLVLVTGSLTQDSIQKLAEKFKVSSECIYPLNLPKDARLAARQLYHELHQLSAKPSGFIVYWKGPEWTSSEWAGIVDRLERAATYKLD